MIRIEPAAPSDFLAIAALDRAAWQTDRNARVIPDGEHVWRTWCEHVLTFVARRDGQIIGTAVAFPCVNGAYFVHKVIVEHSRRGHGIGSRLLAALLAEIDRLRVEAFLTADPANESALRLYEKAGFTQRERVAGYYREDEDRFVLARPARRDRHED